MTNFDHNCLKPLFLGPKAENAERIERLLIECFRDHCFWRRNFHPEDVEWVKESDKLTSEYVNTQAVLQDRLNQLVAELKRSAPTFHPRYLGHMHTDLLIAGVLGEFAALFYSQNNVVAEASPVTAKLESSAVKRIASMLGYQSHGAVAPWGNICSGGTTANIQAIWVARNVRLVPISVYLALRQLEKDKGGLTQETVSALLELDVTVASKIKKLVKLNTLELLNIPIPEILALRERIIPIVLNGLQLDNSRPKVDRDILENNARNLTDSILRTFSPAEQRQIFKRFGLPGTCDWSR